MRWVYFWRLWPWQCSFLSSILSAVKNTPFISHAPPPATHSPAETTAPLHVATTIDLVSSHEVYIRSSHRCHTRPLPPHFRDPIAPLTHLSILPIPHRPQKPPHIHLLRAHLQHPGMLQHPPRRRAAGRFLLQTKRGNTPHQQKNSTESSKGGGLHDSPALDEILEHLAPPQLLLRLVLQLGNRLPHNIRQ